MSIIVVVSLVCVCVAYKNGVCNGCALPPSYDALVAAPPLLPTQSKPAACEHARHTDVCHHRWHPRIGIRLLAKLARVLPCDGMVVVFGGAMRKLVVSQLAEPRVSTSIVVVVGRQL